MGDLTGQTVASTYSQLLNVASLDGTFRNVTDGDGTASGLTLSTGGVRASLLNATGAVTFDSTLEVTGAITATGGVTGDVTGNVTGNVTGDLTGNATGDLTGNIKTTDASATVTTILNANVGSDDAATFTGNVTGSADTLTTGRTISATGDIAWTSPAFDGSGDVTAAATISDDAVTTAKILDNQVTGAKIAMGSDAQGDILYYDGADYARLAAGTSGQVLQTGGSSGTPSWVDKAINTSVGQIQFYTGDDSTTTGTFTVPSGVTRVKVSVQGGGGGGTTNGHTASKGGGGGGAYFEKVLTVTAGDTINWVAGTPKTYSGNTPYDYGNSSSITYDSVTYTAGAGADGYTDGRSSGTGGSVSGTVDIAISGTGNTVGGEAGQHYLRTFGNGGDAYDGTGTTGKAGFVKFEY